MLKMKKKLFKGTIFALLVFFLVPIAVQAQVGNFVKIENPIKAENFWELMDALINIIFVLALGVAPIMFIVAGFYFIGAVGDPEKIRTAKKMVLYTLIGLLIIFCAKGLVALLGDALGFKTPFNK